MLKEARKGQGAGHEDGGPTEGEDGRGEGDVWREPGGDSEGSLGDAGGGAE